MPKSYEIFKISFDTITMILLSIKSYKNFILKNNNNNYYITIFHFQFQKIEKNKNK